jgi:transposase
MGKLWVGLDVGEAQTSVCVLDRGDEPLLECSIGSTPDEIARALSAFTQSDINCVALENGAQIQLARSLVAMGYPISVLDPLKTHRFLSIRQHKTDLNDARGLAEIARLGATWRLAVHTKSDETRDLRNRLVVRSQLIKQRTSARNALRSMLRNHGSRTTRLTRGGAVRAVVETEFAELEAQGGPGVTERLKPLLNILEALSVYTGHINRELDLIAKAHPTISHLMQVPGVGTICAVSFYTAIDDPHRFERAADVSAYLGMIPKVKQSGVRTQHARITRAGNAMTRTHLVLAAGVLMSRVTQKCAIQEWGLTLKKRVGYGKARVAVARKLAVVLLSIWKSGRDFEPYPTG